MSALMIGEREREQIQSAMARALAKPVPTSMLKNMAYDDQSRHAFRLHDRDENRAPFFWKLDYIQRVELPVGFTAVISFEEQPVGLCKHLSVSIDKHGMLPNLEAVKMIGKEFGIVDPPISIFIEEYEP